MMKRLLAAAAIATLAGTCYGQGTMYLLDSNRNIYTVDPLTGITTHAGVVSAGGTVGGLAYDCVTGTMYMTSTSEDILYRLDLNTFTATQVGPYIANVVMHGLEFNSSNNTLYGGSDGNLYTIDTSTGAATIIGNAGFTSFFNLGWHAGRGVMYGTSSSTDSLYAIDLNTGAGTLIGPLNGPTNPHGLTYVPHLNALYLVCSQTDTLYTVDVDTGAATVVAQLPAGNWLGLAWVPLSCSQSEYDALVSLQAPTSCTIGEGGQGTFIAHVYNAGSEQVTNATVTFTIPANTSFVSSTPAATPVGNTVSVNLGTLASNTSAQFAVTLTFHAQGVVQAEATVSIDQADEIPTNNTAVSGTNIVSAIPPTAAATALLTNIASLANSEVPGLPGVRFSSTGFERPYRSHNGQWFVLLADTDAATSEDQVLLVSNPSGVISVGAREGQFGPDGFNWGVMDNIVSINDSGQYVFSTNTTGPTVADEVVVMWDGTQFLHPIVEGNLMPNNFYNWGTTNGSATIQNDGTISVQTNLQGATTATDTAVVRANGEIIVAQEGITIPTGQPDGANFTVKSFDSGSTDGQGFFLSADGAHHLWTGAVNDATSQDRVVVVDGAVVLQENQIIPGSNFNSPVGSTIAFAFMETNGDWFAYGSNVDGSDWAIRNGSVLATNFQPITPGTFETWSDATFSQLFFLLAGNNRGDYVIGGTTDSPDPLANAVIVLNGQTVLARENDPVDADGNGVFDDGLFIRSFRDDYAFLTDTDLYVVVTLRATPTAKGCITQDPDLGQALIRIPLPPTGPTCGTADFDGDGDVGTDADIEAFFSCLAGNCCDTCHPGGADFDGDGDSGTDADIEAFFRVLSGGNC
jgi:uncharacterized repeat protein (TIGR01451 family)